MRVRSSLMVGAILAVAAATPTAPAHAAINANSWQALVNGQGKALDVMSKYSNLLTHKAYNGGDYQQFMFESYWGSYRLRHKASNQCARAVVWVTSEGAWQIDLGPCLGGNEFRWTVDYPDSSKMRIRNVRYNKCLTIERPAWYDPEVALLRPCVSSPGQVWSSR